MSHAKQLAGRGFYVFPCAKNSKKPIAGISWTAESTLDTEQIEKWERSYPDCNWGIDCGKSGLAVIDIDIKDGKDGFDTLVYLDTSRGLKLPKTMIFETASGCHHLIFSGNIKSGADDIGPGVDTRSRGGYIVAPGSTIDGGRYKVIVNAEIQPIPAWVSNMVSPRKQEIVCVKTDIELDLAHNVDSCQHYLTNRAAPAIEGQGGDAHTFQVICHVRDYGISQDKALELILEHWNDKCEPPWEFDDLDKKIHNAYAYAQNSPGAKTAQAAFDAPVDSAFPKVAPGGDQDNKGNQIELLPMMDLTEALSPAPPQEWLLKGWIPSKEMCLFTGKEGTGKSLLALQLAMSAAYGAPWLGQKLERTYQVLYISCEDDKDEIKRRCNSIARLPEYAFLSGEVDPSRFRPVPLVGEDNAMVYEDNWKLEAGPIYLRLNATLNHLGWREPLIILDTLSDMFMANENNRAMVQHFVKRYLGRFRRDYDATIITLAHPPKTEAEYSGSTAWPAAHRSCIGVMANPSKSLPDHRIVKLWKGNRTSLKDKQFHIVWKQGAFVPVSTDDILSEEIDAATENMNIVFSYVETYAENPKSAPLGINPQSANFLGKIPMRDLLGTLMDTNVKIEYARLLEGQGRVTIVTGTKHDNGIFPVKETT